MNKHKMQSGIAIKILTVDDKDRVILEYMSKGITIKPFDQLKGYIELIKMVNVNLGRELTYEDENGARAIVFIVDQQSEVENEDNSI